MLFCRVLVFLPILAAAVMTSLDYPKVPTSDVVDDFFGEKVADPFRGLEDSDAPETRRFVEQENALTEAWIPGEVQKAYQDRLRKLMNYPRRSMPGRYGEWWITSRNSGLQPHYVVYKQRGEDGEPEVLIDPNTFSKDGTVALSETAFTKDGSLVAYGKSVGGSDNQTIYVRDVATGKDLSDELKDMRFATIAWAPDNSGFWYNKFPDPEARQNSTIYWHRLGDPQSKDKPILSLPDTPDVDIAPAVTEDGKYLLIYSSLGTDPATGIRVREIEGDPGREGGFREVFPLEESSFVVVANEGPMFYVVTDDAAPRSRLIVVDINQPQREHWRELIPEMDELLDDVTMVGDRFVVTTTKDVHSNLRVHDRSGKVVAEVPLPGKGSVGGVSGRRDNNDFFFTFSSYTIPGIIYRYALADGELTEFYRSAVKFDPDLYITEQVFFESKDGTRVPMFVTHRKDMSRNGENPTILYGYGGFSINLEPGFNSFIIPWLEQGGVYVVANLRGGAEYGEEWHDAGRLEKKQNVFDDFIAAAERLIADKVTSPSKLAIKGGSNGGLLTAAVVLQRPDLFGAVLSHVPVTDMLRYQRFGTGRFWIPEYGDATGSREAFEWLRAYSPLHNVKKGAKYPPILVLTADGDDRVVPAHAFKFVATLQADAGPGVYLLRHEVGAGHGAGKPLEMSIKESAATYAFLTKALGLPAPHFADEKTSAGD